MLENNKILSIKGICFFLAAVLILPLVTLKLTGKTYLAVLVLAISGIIAGWLVGIFSSVYKKIIEKAKRQIRISILDFTRSRKLKNPLRTSIEDVTDIPWEKHSYRKLRNAVWPNIINLLKKNSLLDPFRKYLLKRIKSLPGTYQFLLFLCYFRIK